MNVPPFATGAEGRRVRAKVALREEEDVDEIRRELGDRVYGSAIAFGLAVGGLVVLLVLRAVIGL